MSRESTSKNESPRQRSVPSLDRTMQALRAIRRQRVRIAPEMRIIALRGDRQLS